MVAEGGYNLLNITSSWFITEHCLIKAIKTLKYRRIKGIMVTVKQKLGLATKKLKKSTEDWKNLCDDGTEKTMKKIKLNNSTLELHIQELRSLVED